MDRLRRTRAGHSEAAGRGSASRTPRIDRGFDLPLRHCFDCHSSHGADGMEANIVRIRDRRRAHSYTIRANFKQTTIQVRHDPRTIARVTVNTSWFVPAY